MRFCSRQTCLFCIQSDCGRRQHQLIRPADFENTCGTADTAIAPPSSHSQKASSASASLSLVLLISSYPHHPTCQLLLMQNTYSTTSTYTSHLAQLLHK